MKTRLFTGISTLVIGTLFILVPHYLLPICQSTLTAGNMSVPMKCFWTANSETGVGGVIALSGLLLCLCVSPGMRLGISMMNVLLAILAVALPAFLIGVCANETMPCHMGTLPALYILAALLLLVSLINIVRLRGGRKA